MHTSSFTPSARAQFVTRRSYNRPLNIEGTIFETWAMSVERTIGHQRWLWSRAQGDDLLPWQEEELDELRQLMLNRQSILSGRTMWLGGTELVKRREASQFNCSFLNTRTVHDMVDAFWLLLQGCGVGFRPMNSVLSGFVRKMEIEVVRSKKVIGDPKGNEGNVETYDPETRIWTIRVGDSAEAWAKALGKLIAGKYPAKKIVINLEEIRAAGQRLKGYGFLCSGDATFATALQAICGIMNRYAGKMLSKEALWDIINWMGTTLSSRRSAEIGLIEFGDPEWETIATRKYPGFDLGADYYRDQSNNSILFKERPTRRELNNLFELMIANGGSEPGFINERAAISRAPWFAGVNPCGEILLSDRGLCNLVETDLAKFRNDQVGLHRAIYIIARANYRQTCVNLRDGILQSAWHENNEYLRLCGVGLTGICRRGDMTPYEFRQLRYAANTAAYSMADELGLERPKNVCTVKPSGTMGKCMDTTEGAHRPLAMHIINNVTFSRHDPLVERLLEANYKIFDHPTKSDSVLAAIPVPCFDDAGLTKLGQYWVNNETAVEQLDRYRNIQRNYNDQNTSITVSYTPEQKKDILKWVDKNWDNDFVAVAWLFKNDPTRTAKDLGYAYLPQECVTKEFYEEYSSKLLHVDIEQVGSMETEMEEECKGGVCPTR